MVKRIPCRVVRTKPLGKSRLNHFNCKFGDANPQYKSTNDAIIYTRMLEITSISTNRSLAGGILDCYV
ncbi:MAG: hypothetical protein GWN67_19840 [Phycisphaerae bacterium]|nr:hypothetical protein [Phycisphaerae bacterium]NIU58547.1 hypothetical protein [Phycisphaerae bacterium]